MSLEAERWAYSVNAGGPTRKQVLVYLAYCADRTTWSCYPGQELISAATELSASSVRRALGDLEEAGLISRQRRNRKNGSRTSDVYVLHRYRGTGLPVTVTGRPEDPTGHSDATYRSQRPDLPVTVTGPELEVEPPVELEVEDRSRRSTLRANTRDAPAGETRNPVEPGARVEDRAHRLIADILGCTTQAVRDYCALDEDAEYTEETEPRFLVLAFVHETVVPAIVAGQSDTTIKSELRRAHQAGDITSAWFYLDGSDWKENTGGWG